MRSLEVLFMLSPDEKEEHRVTRDAYQWTLNQIENLIFGVHTLNPNPDAIALVELAKKRVRESIDELRKQR